MVTVLVGKDETPFVLHRAPLFRKSSFFRKGLSSNNAGEVNDDLKPAKVPAIEARYFKVYTHWVYSSQLDIALLGCRMTTGHRPEVSFLRHATEAERDIARRDNADLINDLVRLWADGDFLGDVQFQNIVSDELVEWLLVKEKCLTLMPTATFSYFNNNTLPECPLRQILIDWADLELTSERGMKSLGETAPKWLVTGVLLSKIRREDGKWKEDPREGAVKERYHVRQAIET
jgi:hypothetical protein